MVCILVPAAAAVDFIRAPAQRALVGCNTVLGGPLGREEEIEGEGEGEGGKGTETTAKMG